jgi:hypothetical protein
MAKINIDFSVHSNPYFLKVMDLSIWGVIEDQPSIIEITLPGYDSVKTKFFDKFKTNIFNSLSLDINCVDNCDEVEKLTLPDGIYTIKVIGSPSKYSSISYYLKTDLFDMEVDKIYIDNINSTNRSDLINKLAEVEFLMKGAEAHLRFDDLTMAGMNFTKAQEMIEDLKKCKTCS